jgi:hypothetical protein
MLATDELRAWYGPEHVALAVDRGAVGTLLISDDLFRFVRIFPFHVATPDAVQVERPGYTQPICRDGGGR